MSEENNMTTVETDSLGTISFADEVVSVIAGLAAMEIPGVLGMSSNIVGGIAEMIGRKNLSKGVRVEVGNSEAAIDLYVYLEYGVRIPEVAENLQENVKKAVETMTGLRCVEVNVHVMGVRHPKDKDKEIQEIEPPAPPRVK